MTTPTKIGKYSIVGTLGKGAMGEVYVGEDPYIGRRVAIKVMRDADPAATERFRHEARIIGSFSHPHIVLLLEFGFEGEQPFLVMEYLEGRSLEEWMRAPHTLHEQLELMSGLCGALAYAHARGVLHRDVKPANIQVIPDGRSKLMDFGIAHAPSAKLTATGTIMGTPNYMAPEIVRDAAYSERSDLYSLAVVFYELLTGRNPFVAQNVAACLHNVLHVVPQRLHELRPDLPAPLADAVDACLRKAPEERLPNVAALGAVVDGVLTGTASGLTRAAAAAVTLEETHFIPRTTLPSARSRALRPVWALAALLGVALVVWLTRRSGPASVPTEPSASPAAEAAAPAAPAPAPSGAGTGAATPTPPAPSSGAAPHERVPTPLPAPRLVATMAPRVAPSPTPLPAVATPTPAPLATAVPQPVVRTEAPRPAPTAPTDSAPPLPALVSLKPRAVRLGASMRVEINGQNLRADLKVEVRHGRRTAPGIRVLSQHFESPTRIVATLLVDGDVPIDTYVLVLTDATGRRTNSLPLEVAL